MKNLNKNKYRKGKCGQGYEDDRCVECKWIMGLDMGIMACGKGFEESGIVMLGKK